jgi:hypothetical protein
MHKMEIKGGNENKECHKNEILKKKKLPRAGFEPGTS